MRSDRNLYSKNLIESQDEIAEMKRKFKIMNHQIEQLKEEITAKDHALVKEHFDHQKVEKQREQLKNELDKLRKLKGKAESTIEKQHAELGKLTSIIQKLESDAIQQHKEYDQVINERDILGTQLIRRNDELALLCVPLVVALRGLPDPMFASSRDSLPFIAFASARFAANDCTLCLLA